MEARVIIKGSFIKETDKAIGLRCPDINGRKTVTWIPLSTIHHISRSTNRSIALTCDKWIVESRNLDYEEV